MRFSNCLDSKMDIQKSKDRPLIFLATLVCTIQVATIWSISNLIPFQDYYDWLYQSKVLFELWHGDPFASTHFRLINFWEFSPNGFVTFFLALLQYAFTLENAGKILLTLIILLFNLGGFRLIKSTYPNSPFKFLVLLFSFHFFFYKGFLSYCLGLSILLNLIAILSAKKEWSLGSCSLFILSTSLFLFTVHGFIFGVYVFCIIVWLALLPNTHLSVRNKFICGLALAPSLIFLGSYIFSSSGNTDSFAVLYQSVVHWAQVHRYGSHFYSRIALNTTWLSLSILNMGIVFLVLGMFFYQRKKFIKEGFLFILFVSFFVMMVFNPFYQIGLFFPLSSRLILLVVLLLGSLFKFNRTEKKVSYLILSASLIVSIAHFVHLNQFDHKNKALLSSVKEKVGLNKDVLIIAKTFPKDFDKSLLSVFSGNTDPYLFLNSAVNKNQLFNLPYIQETGIIRLKSDEAIEKSMLAELIFNTHDFEQAIEKLKVHSAGFYSEYSSIILIGTDETKTRITKELSLFFKPSEINTNFTVLTRKEL